MLKRLIPVLLIALPATPVAASLPKPVKAMLDAAIAGGQDAEIATIAKFAKQAHPASAREVDALVSAHRAEKQAVKHAKLEQAGLLDLWDGQAELGGSRSTGNTDTFGITAGYSLQREGRDWRHKLRARGDYQESDGVATREALLVSYEPSYKVGDALSVYGLAQLERDTFLGYSLRLSLSGGVGYRALSAHGLTLDLNLGPAFRETRFITGDTDETVAGRGSLGLRWALTPTLKFSNDTAVYAEKENSTLATTSSIDAKIMGALSARLSYHLSYESDPPFGRESLDTLSRAALVYDF